MIAKYYDLKNLKGDITGGLVAGVVALPLALAFGVQSGLGAIAGLYGAIAVGIFAAIFGGTATQASGPTGPMTVVSAALVAAAIDSTGSLQSAMPIIILTFLLGGVFQIIFGFLNIASYVKYFPYLLWAITEKKITLPSPKCHKSDVKSPIYPKFVRWKCILK